MLCAHESILSDFNPKTKRPPKREVWVTFLFRWPGIIALTI